MANVVNQLSIAYGVCRPCGNKFRLGVLEKGSPTVSAEGLPVGRVTDTVRAVCGHCGKIKDGITTITVDSLPIATTDSIFEGDYTGKFKEGVTTVTANFPTI